MKNNGIYLHVTFACKYRKKQFLEEFKKRCIMQLIEKVAEKINMELIGYAVDDDHIHLLIDYDPKLIISRVICRFKAITAKRYNVIFGRSGQPLWQQSYAVESVSLYNTTKIQNYLKHHKFNKV
jgi:putative transposase